MKQLLLLSITFITLSAPSLAYAGDSTFWGTTMGAALGGYVGSTIGKGAGNLAATGAGVFIGGVMGNSMGRSMDRSQTRIYTTPRYQSYDAYRPSFNYYQPTYVAPPAPRPRTIYIEQPEIIEFHHVPRASYSHGAYAGPPSGGNYEHKHKGQHCREFTQTIKIDGQRHESYGTACLRPDGSWQIVQ